MGKTNIWDVSSEESGLLADAAIAIGIPELSYIDGVCGYKRIRDGAIGWRPWNPLHNAEDAISVAIKLGMNVSMYHGQTLVSCDYGEWDRSNNMFRIVRVAVQHGKTPIVATMQAITKAAAEVTQRRRSMELVSTGGV